jgi:hypothetical protein
MLAAIAALRIRRLICISLSPMVVRVENTDWLE